MRLEDRIEAFADLGDFLRNSLLTDCNKELNSLVENQHSNNAWFTTENVRIAIDSIAKELTAENLLKWTAAYPSLSEDTKPLNVGVIMAGNIPLAGFHDFLTVLISGNNIIARTSSKDPDLIRYLGNKLSKINPAFNDRIKVTGDILKDFDAVIATGSDNSSRYFEDYFGKYSNIIRKNRNSIAIIEGDETPEELAGLGKDIFTYFGLGCRSVSKVFLPEGYDPESLADNWKIFNTIVNHPKYSNNYDFNKAVYIVNKEHFIDSGFLLLKEDSRLSSPVSVLYYEFYKDSRNAEELTYLLKEKIQCLVGNRYTPFGHAQSPHLWDYADGSDTLDFLLKKKSPGIL